MVEEKPPLSQITMAPRNPKLLAALVPCGEGNSVAFKEKVEVHRFLERREEGEAFNGEDNILSQLEYGSLYLSEYFYLCKSIAFDYFPI